MFKEFNKINTLIKNSERMLLLGHKNPDGDCLGALSALMIYLKKQNKVFQAVFFEELNPAFDFLPNFKNFIISPENFDPQAFDLLIALDASNFQRTGLGMEILINARRPKIINIDPH